MTKPESLYIASRQDLTSPCIKPSKKGTQIAATTPEPLATYRTPPATLTSSTVLRAVRSYITIWAQDGREFKCQLVTRTHKFAFIPGLRTAGRKAFLSPPLFLNSGILCNGLLRATSRPQTIASPYRATTTTAFSSLLSKMRLFPPAQGSPQVASTHVFDIVQLHAIATDIRAWENEICRHWRIKLLGQLILEVVDSWQLGFLGQGLTMHKMPQATIP